MSHENEKISLNKDQLLSFLEMTGVTIADISKLVDLKEEKELEMRKIGELEKNHNFTQIYNDAMPELRWLAVNHAFAHALLYFILEHMDKRNALACSYKVLQDYFGKHKTTIYRNLKILEDNGFIDIMKMGTSNVYVVNHELAWSDKNTNKDFAVYDGKILVSKSENKDFQIRKKYDRLKKLREDITKPLG